MPFCVIRNSKEFPMTQKSRESSTDRGFLCYTYRSIRPARSVFHAHKYDSTSYTCRSSSYSSAWLYSDASDLSPFSLYSLIPDRNYLFMKIHPFSGFVKCFLNFKSYFLELFHSCSGFCTASLLFDVWSSRASARLRRKFSPGISCFRLRPFSRSRMRSGVRLSMI